MSYEKEIIMKKLYMLIILCLLFNFSIQVYNHINLRPIEEETFNFSTDTISRWDSLYKTNCSPDFLKMRQATVEIKAGNQGGAGAIVHQDKEYLYILTAQHCIEGSIAIQIKDIYGEIFRIFGVPTKDIIKHKKVDLALIKVRKPDSIFGQFKISGTPLLIGEDIHTIGHPANTYYTVTRGNVSSYTKRTYNNTQEEYTLITAPSWGGNSGGAVVNKDTELVGIAVGILYVGENWRNYKDNIYLFHMTYSVKLDIIRDFLVENGI